MASQGAYCIKFRHTLLKDMDFPARNMEEYIFPSPI